MLLAAQLLGISPPDHAEPASSAPQRVVSTNDHADPTATSTPSAEPPEAPHESSERGADPAADQPSLPTKGRGRGKRARLPGDLSEGSTTRARKVVVHSSRYGRLLDDAPLPTRVIDREALDDVGAENVAEALQSQPGVQLQRSFAGTGIRLLGLDPKYTVILLDGRRLTGRVDGVLDLNRLPVEDLQQIEVTTGPGSVLAGADALAGVVDLRTRPPRAPWEGNAHLAYGSRNAIDASGRIGGAKGRFATALSGSYRRADAWDRDPATVATTGNAFAQATVGSRTRVQATKRTLLRGEANASLRDTSGVQQGAGAAVLDRRNRQMVAELATGVDHDGRTLHVESWIGASLVRDQFVLDQRGDDALDQNQITWDGLGTGTLTFTARLSRHHTLTLGNDLWLEHLATPRLDPRAVTRGRVGTFVQHAWRPKATRGLEILPAIRVDFDSLFDVHATPRLAFALDPHADLRIRASIGHAYRAPSFREMYLRFDNQSAGYLVQGNPQLEPETSWGSIVRVDWVPSRAEGARGYRPDLAFGAEAWVLQLEDAIVTDTVREAAMDQPTIFSYRNVGAASSAGLQGEVGIIWHPVVTTRGSVTYTRARDLSAGRELPGVSPALATLGVELRSRVPRWETKLFVRGGWAGRRQFFVEQDDGSTVVQRADALLTLDLRLAQSLTKWVELFVGVDNVADTGDATFNVVPPRSFYGGLTVRH